MIKQIMVFSFSLGACISSFAYSSSCNCPPLKKLSVEAMKDFPLIFQGKVDSVTVKNGASTVWFKVDEVFRGASGRWSFVSIENEEYCPVQVEKGDEWIVYAYYSRLGNPAFDFCSRSRKHFSDASRDYNAMNLGMDYQEEFNFLKKNSTGHFFSNPVVTGEHLPPSGLIHPSPIQLICWLILSLSGLLLIIFLMKKFLK